MAKLVAVNEKGLRIGEDHQRARLTNHEVDLIRQLHEDLINPLGYRVLSKMFEVNKTTIRRICNYQMHNQTVAKFRKVG